MVFRSKYIGLGCLSILIGLHLSSCQDDGLIDELDSHKPVVLTDKTVATVQPFVETEDYTRSVLTPTQTGLSFAWKTGDQMGVYATNAMANFTLQEIQSDGASATFDGGGFALQKDGTYYAFYPYSAAATDKTAVPVSYLTQIQTANNSTDHLPAYDFMVAKATSNDKNEAVFDFAHLGAVLRFQVVVPKAATYKTFSFTTATTYIKTKGTVDLTAAQPKISSTNKSKSYTLKLGKSGAGFAVDAANPVLTVYMSVPPVDLSKESLILKLTTKDGEAFQSVVQGKKIQAGGAYGFAAKHTYVDMGLTVMWATTNVGANAVTGYGGYYSWGETTEKTNYEWSGYKYCKGTKESMTKYGMDNAWGVKDGKNVLDDADDVAVVTWGSKWRMPTSAEEVALYENCYWLWTYNYNNSGIAGYIVYKAKDEADKGKHSPDNPTLVATYTLKDTHIFLPAAGLKATTKGTVQNANEWGYYWSRSLYDDYAYDGLMMYFRDVPERELKGMTWYYRSTGYSVRPVWVP